VTICSPRLILEKWLKRNIQNETKTESISEVKPDPESCDLQLSNAPLSIKNDPELGKNELIFS
jgi:hypothetical protein